jgi:hypothetical protein
VKADEEGTRKLLRSLNGAAGEARLTEEQLIETFRVWWPDLSTRLKSVPAGDLTDPAKMKRPTEDILAEILTNTRELLRERRMGLGEALRVKNTLLGRSLAKDRQFVARLKDQLQQKPEDEEDL